MGPKQTQPVQMLLSLGPLMPPTIPESVRLQVLSVLATMLHESALGSAAADSVTAEGEGDERQT